MITHKEHIINYFKSGIRDTKEFKIGIEHEKFLFDKKLIAFDEPFKKLINQGMILGRSNFVYRINNSNTFVTKSKKDDYKTTALHVDINMVNNDILDLDKSSEYTVKLLKKMAKNLSVPTTKKVKGKWKPLNKKELYKNIKDYLKKK